MSQFEQPSELYCPDCGYDLRAIAAERCPECGLEIDRSLLGKSVIPWSHRMRVGRVRALVRTIWLAIRSPQKLSREVARPESYRDAQQFRWTVVFVAWVPLCVMALVWRMDFGPKAIGFLESLISATGPFPGSTVAKPFSGGFGIALCWVAGVLVWPVIPVAIAMFLAIVTGISSYFFHPRKLDTIRQNRAVALSYYAAAPFALFVIPAIIGGIAIGVLHTDIPVEVGEYRVNVAIGLAVGGSLVAVFGAWWLITLRLLHLTTDCTTSRLITAAVLLPILAGFSFLVGCGLFPAICGFVRLIIESYRI